MAVEKIDLQLCSGCGSCVKSCPTDVFRLDKVSKKAVVQYPEDCMLCGWCLVECQTDAITLTWEKVSPLVTSWG
jgi:NAD-dependent dihydropyrimidine dehydrogenase PreA subunit